MNRPCEMDARRTASPLTPALSPLRGEGEPMDGSWPQRTTFGSWMLYMNRSLKIQKGISVGVVTLFYFVLLASLQSAEPWKPLFNGKDFTGWTVPARGGALSPANAGWKMENGIVVGGQAGPGQK